AVACRCAGRCAPRAGRAEPGGDVIEYGGAWRTADRQSAWEPARRLISRCETGDGSVHCNARSRTAVALNVDNRGAGEILWARANSVPAGSYQSGGGALQNVQISPKGAP